MFNYYMNKIYLLIIIVFIFVFFNYSKETFTNYQQNKIPSIIFKTGPFNEIPNNILEIINHNCQLLNCTYQYYDDNNCRNFIKNNYNSTILQAYDSLIPTAYKADLWRYCILYKYGGIYGDLTQTILKKIDFNKNNIDMLLVKDRSACYHNNNIQISFMATKRNNNFYKFLIENISIDILNKKKGACPLDITGPSAFGRYFCKYFHIKEIKTGLNNYVGLDNQNYKIDIPFYMYSADYICDINNNEKIIKNKMKDHVKIIYKSNNSMNNKNKYHYQWKNNIIFK